MRKLLPILVCMLIGQASAAVSADAQCSDVLNARAQRQIALTDLRLDQAAARLGTLSGENAARAELEQARRFQAQARQELASGHCRFAVDLTLRARSRALRALIVRRVSSAGSPDPERVLAQLDRTQEVIDHARGAIEECEDDRARESFRSADEMQRRAEESFHSDRFLGALQLTVAARERVNRASSLCRVSEDPDGSAERALERTDAMLTQAVESGAENAPFARRALLRARALQAQAYRELRAGRDEESLRLTRSARVFAQRAIRRSN